MYSKSEQTKHNKKTKRKRCKLESCNKLFAPVRDFQKCCSFEHDMEFINDKNNLKNLINEGKKREVKTANKKKKEFNQSDKSYQMEKAQAIFNKFIRLRDIDLPCISCDYDWKANGSIRQAHASHYMSVGKSKKLRFNEYNVHKSCQICNSHLSGNLVEYRPRLIKKIGLEKVEELEKISKDASPSKYTIEDYKKIIHIYTSKISDLS